MSSISNLVLYCSLRLWTCLHIFISEILNLYDLPIHSDFYSFVLLFCILNLLKKLTSILIESSAYFNLIPYSIHKNTLTKSMSDLKLLQATAGGPSWLCTCPMLLLWAIVGFSICKISRWCLKHFCSWNLLGWDCLDFENQLIRWTC